MVTGLLFLEWREVNGQMNYGNRIALVSSAVEEGKRSDDLQDQDRSSLQWREVNGQMIYRNRIAVVSSGER